MAQSRPGGSVSDRLAAAETAALVGRVEERARLSALLAAQGPAAVFVHGPGGIGKTTLVTGTLAALPLNWVRLDGRRMEPTVPGALVAIGAALGGPAPPSATAAAEQVAAAGVDGLGVRQLRAAQPARRLDPQRADQRPSCHCHYSAGRTPRAERGLAHGAGMAHPARRAGGRAADRRGRRPAPGRPRDRGRRRRARIRTFARGHPLAVVVAGEALARRPGLPLGSGAPAEVVEELFAVILDDLGPRERAVAEAASVLRRVTLPLPRVRTGRVPPT